MKALLCLLALSLTALADWKDQLAPATLGSHPRLAPTKLTYTLSWNGAVDAGTVTFRFGLPSKDPAVYEVDGQASSIGFAKKLFNYSVNMQGHLRQDTLQTISFSGAENDNGETKSTKSVWSPTQVTATVDEWTKKKGNTTQVRTFAFQPTYDILSALLQVRSQPLKDGSTLLYPVMPFDKPYLVRVYVMGREKFKGRDTIKLSVSLQKINPKTLDLAVYKKMTSSTLWITDDAERIPLELRSEVFIGDVRATLVDKKSL
jgi:Protein of unknown function (DUF3108)